jgi:hypothetical protein
MLLPASPSTLASLLLTVPGSGDTPVILACVALSIAVLVFIFAVETDPHDLAPLRSRLDQLLERRDAIYENLRDLKFEYRAGKFAEKDFDQTREALETEAALVLAEIERETGSPSVARRRVPASMEEGSR